MKSSDVVRAVSLKIGSGEDEPLSALSCITTSGMSPCSSRLAVPARTSPLHLPGDVFDPTLRSAFDTGMRIGDIIGTFLAFVLFAPRIRAAEQAQGVLVGGGHTRQLARRPMGLAPVFPAGRRAVIIPVASSPP